MKSVSIKSSKSLIAVALATVMASASTVWADVAEQGVERTNRIQERIQSGETVAMPEQAEAVELKMQQRERMQSMQENAMQNGEQLRTRAREMQQQAEAMAGDIATQARERAAGMNPDTSRVQSGFERPDFAGRPQMPAMERPTFAQRPVQVSRPTFR